MAENYDITKDKTIWTKTVELNEREKLIVGIYSYDGKENKIGLIRDAKVKREDREHSYRKLGRITKSEAIVVQQLLTEALTHI